MRHGTVGSREEADRPRRAHPAQPSGSQQPFGGPGQAYPHIRLRSATCRAHRPRHRTHLPRARALGRGGEGRGARHAAQGHDLRAVPSQGEDHVLQDAQSRCAGQRYDLRGAQPHRDRGERRLLARSAPDHGQDGAREQPDDGQERDGGSPSGRHDDLRGRSRRGHAASGERSASARSRSDHRRHRLGRVGRGQSRQQGEGAMGPGRDDGHPDAPSRVAERGGSVRAQE